MKLRLLIFLSLLAFGWQLHAQEKLSQLPIRISVMDESISLPNGWFTRYSFNPAITVGTEYVLKGEGASQLIVGGNLGYYYHKNWQSAFFLNGELGYKQHFNRLAAYLKLGVGYAHAFTPQPIFEGTETSTQEARDWGYPIFMPSATVGLSYRLRNEPYSPEIFAQMMTSAEFPFNLYSGLHQFVGLGFTFYPFAQS
ncbi:MAG: hypothetical protein AAFY71_02135 [Bacteroidota bacterium]